MIKSIRISIFYLHENLNIFLVIFLLGDLNKLEKESEVHGLVSEGNNDEHLSVQPLISRSSRHIIKKSERNRLEKEQSK